MGERSLKLALMKAFNVLKQVLNDWTITNGDSEKLIKSQANMLEQYECCQKASVIDIPFHSTCPDLKDRLQFKIMTELEEKTCSLKVKINQYKECHSKVSQQYHNVIKIYRNYSSSDLSINVMTHSSTSYPSLADMMEFLKDVEQLLYQEYYCKKCILEEMMSSNDITSENMVSQWTSEDIAMSNKIKDYLCYLTFLMEEKI